MKSIWLIACAGAISLASCGPTHTSGTKALPADQRTVLTVHREIVRPFLGPEHVGTISTVWIDGLPFSMDSRESRQFWLAPGEHVVVLAPNLIASGLAPASQPTTRFGWLNAHPSKVAFTAQAKRQYIVWGRISSAGLTWYITAKDGKPVGGRIIENPAPKVRPGGAVGGL